MRDERRFNQYTASVGGEDQNVGLFLFPDRRDHGRSQRESAGETSAVRFRLIGGCRNANSLAVFKQEDYIFVCAFLIRNVHHDWALAVVEAELYREKIAERGRFYGVEVGNLCTVALRVIGEKHKLRTVVGVESICDRIAVLELLLIRAAQRLMSDLFEISLFCQNNTAVVVFHRILDLDFFDLVGVYDLRAARLTVFLLDLGKLLNDECAYFQIVLDRFTKLVDLVLERFDILDAVYDVLAVQMAQLYFRNVFCLNLIDAKALHEARNDVGFFFGLAHYLYRFVYVEKYLSETAQKVLANLVTLFLGLTIATKMQADAFLNPQTLMIIGLGLFAFVFDTAGGVLFAKFLNLFLKKKVNPMIGAAGISAFPMSARVVHKMGLAEDPQNFLLMHSTGVNVSGQIASVIAGGLILNLIG